MLACSLGSADWHALLISIPRPKIPKEIIKMLNDLNIDLLCLIAGHLDGSSNRTWRATCAALRQAFDLQLMQLEVLVTPHTDVAGLVSR